MAACTNGWTGWVDRWVGGQMGGWVVGGWVDGRERGVDETVVANLELKRS